MRFIEKGEGDRAALIFSPLRTSWPEKTPLIELVEVLLPNHKLLYVDSLQWLGESQDFFGYVKALKKDVSKFIDNADVVMGFSLGGTIIQYLFPTFSNAHKKIIIFSSPTYINYSLNKKLSLIRDLLALGKTDKAIKLFNKYVGSTVIDVDESLNINEQSRLVRGINLLLTADAKVAVSQKATSYLHLLGKNSLLVSPKSVATSVNGDFQLVPNAGMRVLEDNFAYCQELIHKYLES